jgi:hypothetical protein
MKLSAILALTLLLPAAVFAAEAPHKVEALKADLAAPANFEQFVDQSHLRHGGPGDAPVAAAAPQSPRAAALAAPVLTPGARLTPDKAAVPAWTPTKDVGRPAAPPPYANALALTGVVLLGAAAFRSFGQAVAEKPSADFTPADPAMKAPAEAPTFVDLEPLPETPANES